MSPGMLAAIERVDGAEALRRNATKAHTPAREQTALQRVATQVAGSDDGLRLSA